MNRILPNPSPLAPFFDALERGPRTLELDRVAADALLSVGDARGDFMALTLKKHDLGGAHSSLSLKKLTKLFKRLRVDWLGALAPVVLDGGYPLVRNPMAREGGHEYRMRVDAPFDGYNPADDHREIWEHGFPVRLICRLNGTTIGAREWLTVREVHLVPGQGDVPVELSHAVTQHVQRVMVVEYPATKWTEDLRRFLQSIGREALLDAPSEWPEPHIYL